MFTKQKKHQIIFVKKGLLEIQFTRHKGCQFHLTKNVLQDYLPPQSSKQLFLQPLPNINRNVQVLFS